MAVSFNGTTSRVMTSPNGIDWTARLSAANNNWNSVSYGNGIFAAVSSSGSGNRVMTSLDGSTWTIRASAENNYWNSITYGNGHFVAVAPTGTGNRVMTSSFSVVADAPVITSATLGTSTSVNFTQSSSALAPAITNYEYSTENGSNWTAVSPAATTSPLTITGLPDGTSSIMIRAVNSVGSSCPSQNYLNNYNVTFNANEGIGSMATQTIAYTNSTNLTANAFTRDGYTFAGWATTSIGAVAYANSASYTMGTADATLYAKWTLNTYTVTFDTNGGSGSMATQTIAYTNSTNLTANAFTRDGYTFAGWATTSTGTVAYTNSTSYTMGAADVRLFAQWTVNINLNGNITQLRAMHCGQYLPKTDSIIQANPVPGATKYQFEITLTTAPNTVTVYAWPNYYFNPTTVLGGGLAYGKEYSIRVKAFIGTTEYSYGSACIVKAPLAPVSPAATTSIRPIQCGKTSATINTNIQASPVLTATLYEFEVTDASGTRNVSTPLYYFNPMTALAGGVQYGTPYSIKVRTFTGVGGVTPLTAWGDACTVTTPGIPFSKVVTKQCNKTVTTLTPTLYAATIPLAEGYRFRINGTVVEKTTGNMAVLTAAEFPGVYALNTVYSVDIAVKYGGLWQEAYGGDVCTITTPIARMNANQVDNIFNVKAFPNPFASHFTLDIESSSDAQVELKVYDMIGRQLESNQVTVSELSTREIGTNYPAGIYNVLISQGDRLKSIRMIKR